MRPTTMASSAYLMMVLEGWAGMQSCVYKEERRGLSTQPCGEPVLRKRMEEQKGPIFRLWTVCEKVTDPGGQV